MHISHLWDHRPCRRSPKCCGWWRLVFFASKTWCRQKKQQTDLGKWGLRFVSKNKKQICEDKKNKKTSKLADRQLANLTGGDTLFQDNSGDNKAVILLVNTQKVHKFTKDHCRMVSIRWCLLFCVFVVFWWFCWRMGHTNCANAHLHK